MTDWRARTRQIAEAVGIDPDVFERQIKMESNFSPTAYNPKSGATGIAQIIPRWHPNARPSDPEAALNYAARWIRSMLDNGMTYAKALASYNWGPGNVATWNGKRASLPAETRTYLDYILGDAWPLTGGPTAGYRPPVQPGEGGGAIPGLPGLPSLPAVDGAAAWLWGLLDGIRKRMRDWIVDNAKEWAANYGGPVAFWIIGGVLVNFGIIGLVLAGVGNMARSPAGKLGAAYGGQAGTPGKIASAGITAAGAVL